MLIDLPVSVSSNRHTTVLIDLVNRHTIDLPVSVFMCSLCNYCTCQCIICIHYVHVYFHA